MVWFHLHLAHMDHWWRLRFCWWCLPWGGVLPHEQGVQTQWPALQLWAQIAQAAQDFETKHSQNCETKHSKLEKASSAPMEPKQLELTGQPCEWKHLAGISTESPNISYLPCAKQQVENLQFVLQWCLAVFRSDVFQNIHETNIVFEGRIQLLAQLDIHFILR